MKSTLRDWFKTEYLTPIVRTTKGCVILWRAFWIGALDCALPHHHHYTKWGNIFWKNDVPSPQLSLRHFENAKVHWSCSGCTCRPNTLLILCIYNIVSVSWSIMEVTLGSVAHWAVVLKHLHCTVKNDMTIALKSDTHGPGIYMWRVESEKNRTALIYSKATLGQNQISLTQAKWSKLLVMEILKSWSALKWRYFRRSGCLTQNQLLKLDQSRRMEISITDLDCEP